ncbi:pilus assembly protein PilP [Pseudobdellovibrio exovorus]|uniref:Fimbrial assembly protein n=1 Tax=Pseudobdellovibrio exovorus JSS TaxID=1184267 RepID=M4VAF1_9BACT|nr:pilus assembly protein PilP [Pseudobdellovibrio exovorus]AGH94976.1 fimbrial assembly protein [Pseudobdellovibrio exovorus JSS]
MKNWFFVSLLMCLSMLSIGTAAWAQGQTQLTPAEAEALKQQVLQLQQQQGTTQSVPIPVTDANAAVGTAPAAPVPPADPNLITNSRDLDKKVATRVKDPFMLPNHLYVKIKKKLGNAEGAEGFVDESVEPQRRWAIRHYKLVGIIWNVSQPKAMITDKDNTLHMFLVKDKIGNNEGQITAIRDGEVVINEKGSEIRLKLSN